MINKQFHQYQQNDFHPQKQTSKKKKKLKTPTTNPIIIGGPH
jgi:hypothetical protein